MRLRPVDLAREHGLSTQAVRNYEADGILPACERTSHGYRSYTSLHAQALSAFLALIPGHGHPTATSIMRAINRDATDEALRLIDESHARMLEDRRTLDRVERALLDLQSAMVSERRVSEPRTMFIGRLAGELGVRPATLRKWEGAGLVRPHRDPRTGYRVYDEADVRDARLTHQLRRGGYLLEQIEPLIAQLRRTGGGQPLEAALHEWRRRLSARGRAMLSGADKLDAYLRERGPTSSGPSGVD